MSQLNGDAIEKIQELTLAAVHTRELKTTLCPTVMLPSGYGIESTGALTSTVSASVVLWKQPALPISFVIQLAMP